MINELLELLDQLYLQWSEIRSIFFLFVLQVGSTTVPPPYGGHPFVKSKIGKLWLSTREGHNFASAPEEYSGPHLSDDRKALSDLTKLIPYSFCTLKKQRPAQHLHRLFIVPKGHHWIHRRSPS